jgi:hypothetical protein
MATKDVSVALTHGASADGSSWARVVTALKAQGTKVIAAPIPLTSLADDVTALTGALTAPKGQSYWRETPMPAGHSACARPEPVKALV